jgi:hypothetical protein
MRHALLPATVLALTLAAPAMAEPDPVVVELFTSQGCSSCPPADALLGELAGRDDVLALSLHVDYWDWIGWEDTFGHAAFSERQRAYAAADGSTVVYTPQFVVGGSDPVAGPSGMELADLIGLHMQGRVDLIRAEGPDTVALAPREGGGLLILATIDREATVKVLHGENAGHEMTYHNVVRTWSPVAEWDGAAATYALPPAPEGRDRVVLVQAVEDGLPGAILGAHALD